jgi:hypothetical protein
MSSSNLSPELMLLLLLLELLSERIMTINEFRSSSQSWIQDSRLQGSHPMTHPMFTPVDPMFTPVASDLCSMVAKAQAYWAGKQTWQANKANGPARGIK